MELSEIRNSQPGGNIENQQSDHSSSTRSSRDDGFGVNESGNSLLPGSQPQSLPRFGQRAPKTRSIWISVLTWAKGPSPARPYKIDPWFPKIQLMPLHLLDLILPKRGYKLLCLVAFYLVWILAFVFLLQKSIVGTSIPSYGYPVKLFCNHRLWPNSTICGLDGDQCRPFENSAFAFSCPANCKNTILLEPYVVGPQEVNYRSLVVGGYLPGDMVNSAYRGDSFLCAAALHAGVINDETGGCGIVSLTGEQSSYPSVEANGISSIGFTSNFPMSFTFTNPDTPINCKDLRWHLLAVSVCFTSILSIFTTSPALFFSSIFTSIFFHVALISDPPNSPGIDTLISLGVRRFLPATFVAYTVYRTSVHHTLCSLTAQYEKTILWLGACWFGALENYTLDRLPLSRLTPHDLHQQPGAIPVLVSVVVLLLAIALGQAWAFSVEGRFPRYLAVYITMGVTLLVLATIPGLNLRIHHYVLALLLLPGTALQTRPSLLYQGLLVGLFINGVARWGFDSILQTPADLLNDAQLGSLLPEIAPPIIMGAGAATNLTFSFTSLSSDFDGVSVLVNDVERFHAYYNIATAKAEALNFTWTRHAAITEGSEKQQEEEPLFLPEFFRFGYVKLGSLGTTWYGDFTRPAVWEANGTWTHMPPGHIGEEPGGI